MSGEQSTLAVVGDEVSGVRQAVDHLVSLGHRDIAYLAGPQNTSTGAGRRLAFAQATSEYGLASDAALMRECASWTEEEGARQLASLLDSGDVLRPSSPGTT